MKETRQEKQTRIKQAKQIKLKRQTQQRIDKHGSITQTQIDQWHEEDRLKAEAKAVKKTYANHR